MKLIKILEIGDMQNGFTRKDGNLYVSGAEDIITPVNEFLRQIRGVFFDFILIVMDTHFAEEYYLTEESRQFPIHCEYDSRDWELSIDVSDLPRVRYLMKNHFSLWKKKNEPKVIFHDPRRKTAYNNLFCFVDNPRDMKTITPRDEFIRSLCPDDNLAGIDITMIGVASDFCTRYAMEGWLERGASVTILHDLTKGINKETLQILDESVYRKFGRNRLRAIHSTAYLLELKKN